MKSAYLPIVFALLTALFWGMYGPALGKARGELGGSPFKPYVAIGLAYLVWGILGGVIGMVARGDNFSFGGLGGVWGFIAGSLGAWGALALTLAMFTGGAARPHIVMPVVFGGAVTVAAIVSIIQTRTVGNPLLWVGIIGIGIGIILVAANTPHAAPHAKKHDESTAAKPAEPLPAAPAAEGDLTKEQSSEAGT